jgi:hypothetical protein
MNKIAREEAFMPVCHLKFEENGEKSCMQPTK